MKEDLEERKVIKDEEDNYESAVEMLSREDLLRVDLSELLEHSIIKSPPVKLTILKGLNYHT